MARTRYYGAKIGEARVTCECHVTPGTPSSFDDPGDPPEIDILAVTLDDDKHALDGRALKLADKVYENLYDQLYENYTDEGDDE